VPDSRTSKTLSTKILCHPLAGLGWYNNVQQMVTHQNSAAKWMIQSRISYSVTGKKQQSDWVADAPGRRDEWLRGHLAIVLASKTSLRIISAWHCRNSGL